MSRLPTGANIFVMQINPVTLKDDNGAEIAAKNDIGNAPHRIVSVGSDSLLGQILSQWQNNWDANQLLMYLRTQPQLLSQPDQPDGPLMCNPLGNYREIEHNAVGNEEWKACLENDYTLADIQDRQVAQYVLCFWESPGKQVYFLQWELAFFMRQIIAAAKQ